MKKLLCLLLLLALTALCACGAPAQTQEEAAPAAPAEESAAAQPEETASPAAETPVRAETELRFVYHDVEITVLDEAEPLLAALGEPLARYETESCSYEGMDELYDYDGVELSVNEIEGVRRISGIILLDDTVATPEGLRIGMRLQEALALMPTEPEQSGRIYRYTSGSVCLSFSVNETDELITLDYFPAE